MPGDAPLVGRSRELAALDAVMLGAAAGYGAVVAVLGDGGMGKTSLAAAAAAAAHRDHGARVVWARARESGGSPCLWLWDQVLRGLDAGSPEESERRAGFVVPSTGQDRFRQFERLADRLLRAAAQEPTIVVLEDLHWADTDSRDLLDFLAPDVSDAPIVVLATARETELDRLPRADLVLQLRGLTVPEVAEVIARVTGTAPTRDVAEVATSRSGGNPFFVGQLARWMRPGDDVDRWRRDVPDAVRSVLGRRLAELPLATRELLGVAAILGDEVDVGLLAAVAGLEPLELDGRVAPALRAGVVRRLESGRLGFAHALMLAAARDEVPPAACRALHRRCAEILLASATSDQALGAVEAVDGEIAMHLLHAGDAAGAAEWATRAAGAAVARAMYADAARWFEIAVRGAPGGGPMLSVRYADALARSGQGAAAEQAYAGAMRAARRVGDPQVFALAALGTGTLGGGFESGCWTTRRWRCCARRWPGWEPTTPPRVP